MNTPLVKPTSAEAIGEQLREVLERHPIDINEVLRLSNMLSAGDDRYVRFSVDAGVIDRLGRELVSKPETAVAELIKNAYDADASTVDLSFENTDKPGGRLTISDDGLGMTRAQLVSGFMRLSSMDKVREPLSPRLQRRRAGRKGIGRFAVQRLGEQLEIITQTLDSPTALRVVVDWSRFTGGTDLNRVASRIEEVQKQRPEGTTLRINGLREAWSEAALRRVYRIISELIQPVTLRDQRHNSIEVTPNESVDSIEKSTTGVSDFQISLRRGDGEKKTVVDEMSEVLQHALAVIEGFVDNEGHGYWSCKSDKLELDEKILPIGYDREDHEAPFPTLRDVDFKAYYFIHLTEFVPRAVFSSIKNTAEERGGIRLYRNGYRVLPYGEKGDDWLGLDASTRNRTFLPQHATYNFFGFVELSDPEGEVFEETASREYLLENETFKELQNFVYRTLIAAVSRIAELRGRKVTASQQGWKKSTDSNQRMSAAVDILKAATTPSEIEVAPTITNLSSDGNAQANQGQITIPASVVADVVAELTDAIADDKEEKKALIEEVAMLRVLSSLGMVIGEFTHEVKQTLGATTLNAKRLTRMFSTESQEGRVLGQLSQNLGRFNQYVSYFDHAVQDNNRRELEPQDLHVVIANWLKSVAPSAERLKITLHEPVFEDDLIVSCPMHTSEWASVLFNFYSNATKAIRRAKTPGEIGIVVGRGKGRVFLEFSDNGDGVPDKNVDNIFNAFFTTSTPAGAYNDDQDALQGSGLGLKIVRDIAQSYGGEVSLTDAPAGFVTCFRVEFPEASAELKEQYVL